MKDSWSQVKNMYLISIMYLSNLIRFILYKQWEQQQQQQQQLYDTIEGGENAVAGQWRETLLLSVCSKLHLKKGLKHDYWLV